MAIDADLQAISAFVAANPCVLVTLTQAKGSTPRIQGTQMLVSSSDVLGTIGGGQLEYLAIDTARDRLTDTSARQHIAVPLGPEIGQCCGGHVTFTLTPVTQRALADILAAQQADRAKEPNIFIFGAGHVGRALALAMAPLPLNTLLIDGRAEELALADPSVATRQTPLPEHLIREAPAGSAFVVLTHDHALDFLLTHEALRRADAAYVGMIGSATKRATFLSWLRSEVGEDVDLNDLVMPIGKSTLSDKRPAVIAAMVTAEILQAVSRNDQTASKNRAHTTRRRSSV
jgi:xanthine dehydrogenase accessory factor